MELSYFKITENYLIIFELDNKALFSRDNGEIIWLSFKIMG